MSREELVMTEEANPMNFGLGWIPDMPDFRDYTMEEAKVSTKLMALGQADSIKTMHGKMKLSANAPVPTLASMDLRPWCSPIENQGSLGSCTANAAVGLVEYFERKAFGTYIDASRLFVYKTSRDLLGWHGDTGAYMRTAMASLVLFGTPPEKYWPYIIANYDIEPAAFLYALGQNYQAITYYRLDPIGTTKAVLQARIKLLLAAKLPSMIGITVYSSFYQAATTAKVPMPIAGESVIGGHALMIVGYDDNIKIKNSSTGGTETTGAFLIRNSWGTWGGMGGYIYLPYQYVLSGLAQDCWSLLKNEWVNSQQFGL